LTAARAPVRAVPAQTGVWVGIAAISMAFAALSSALVVRQGSGDDWRHFHLPAILFANTLVLIASSLALLVCQARLGRGGVAVLPQAVRWLSLTLGLGLAFVAGQVLAWRDLAAQGLFLATSPSSAFFLVFTALHAVHVLGGVAGLAYARQRLSRSPAAVPAGMLGAVATYWHFMGVLWLYLLSLLTWRIA